MPARPRRPGTRGAAVAPPVPRLSSATRRRACRPCGCEGCTTRWARRSRGRGPATLRSRPAPPGRRRPGCPRAAVCWRPARAAAGCRLRPPQGPSSPPVSVSSSDSVNTSAITCRRSAPSACRSANSRLRLLARMRNRFVTLTPPMRSRPSTPASSSSSVGRTAATSTSRSGITSDRNPASAIIAACGFVRSTTLLCASTWACACAIVSPERSRAIMWDELPACRAFGPRESAPDASGR